jgi:hypothetical protein
LIFPRRPGYRRRYVAKIAPSMTLDETITAYTTQWPYRDFGGQEMAMLLRMCDAALRRHDLDFSTSHTTLWIIREFEKQKQPPSRWIGIFTDGSNYELWLSSLNSHETINENRMAHTKSEDAAESLGRFITELVS